MDNQEEIDIYKCDLCRDILKNEGDFDKHITNIHLWFVVFKLKYIITLLNTKVDEQVTMIVEVNCY